MNSDLIAAYKYWRQTLRGNAARALELARIDIAAGKRRYPHSSRHAAPGAAFAGYGTKSMRWCESPADIGLRFVGYADKLARIDHTGWFADEFQDSTVRGVVYQLTARNGRPIYVSGYDNADNGAADANGPAAIDFGTLWEGEAGDSYNNDPQGARAAARHADSLAERMAEESREYDRAWQAGSQWAERGEEIASERRDMLALLAERRHAKAAGESYPTICARIASTIEAGLDRIRELRGERAALVAGNGPDFWGVYDAELRAAFNEGAGQVVLA